MALIRSHIIQIFWMILFVLNQDQKRLKYSGILMTFFYAMSKSLPGCQQEFYLDRVLIVASHLAYCKVNKRFWKGFSLKLTFLTPWYAHISIYTYTHTHAYTWAYQGKWNVSISENFGNILNERSLCQKQNKIKKKKKELKK